MPDFNPAISPVAVPDLGVDLINPKLSTEAIEEALVKLAEVAKAGFPEHQGCIENIINPKDSEIAIAQKLWVVGRLKCVGRFGSKRRPTAIYKFIDPWMDAPQVFEAWLNGMRRSQHWQSSNGVTLDTG